jgi:uncharacterized protein YkwD
MLRLLQWILSILNQGGNPEPLPPSPPSNLKEELVKGHNNERKGRLIPLLVNDNRLNIAAQKHADEMASRGILSHVGANGSSAGERMMKEGWKGKTWGENIALGQKSASSVMDSWMRSAGHKANILDPSFKAFGIGISKDKNGRIFWCVCFAG